MPVQFLKGLADHERTRSRNRQLGGLLAFVAGAVLAWPTLPALLDRLGVPRYGRTAAIAEARLDTLHVHALPTLLLLVGFAVSVALLAGSTLNPFLYFRF